MSEFHTNLVLAAQADPSSIRAAVLLVVILGGGVMGLVAILLIARIRRRRAAWRCSGVQRPSSTPADVWSESARRLRVPPDSGENRPPIDPRGGGS